MTTRPPRFGHLDEILAQNAKTENKISVGHCLIPLGMGLMPHYSVVCWDYKPRSILAIDTFGLAWY